MSLYDQYRKEHAEDILIEDVPNSMYDALKDWLHDMSMYIDNPYDFAVNIKNRFRINKTIPINYQTSYSTPPDYWKLASFLLNLSQTDSNLFFIIMDYMLLNNFIRERHAQALATILKHASHKYAVQKSGDKYTVTERIPTADLEFMSNVLKGKNIYASEFQDAFAELYGPKPDYTASAGEAFQSLESALKFYFGEDKGKNLGSLLNWLSQNQSAWKYTVPSDSQLDAEKHFTVLVDFVNKSFRKTKHGHADKKLTIEKEHAEVILRSVALLIYELEHTISIPTVDSSNTVTEK